jgi:hypothetical protein
MPNLFRIVVLPEDGESYAVGVDMRTLLEWETKFPGRSFADIAGKTTLDVKPTYELAFLAAQRAKRPGITDMREFKEKNEVMSADVFEKLLAQHNAATAAQNAAQPPADSVDPADDEPFDPDTDKEEVSPEPGPTQAAPSTEP